MPDTTEPVFFLLPDGTEISDDPRWREQKFREKIDAENAELKRSAEKAAREQIKNDKSSTSEMPEEDAEISGKAISFGHMTVEQLKEEAAERDLDISGIKKKSELVALLEQSEE